MKFCRYRSVFSDASLDGNPAAGEGRVRGIFCRRHNLPGFLFHVSHRELPLTVHRQIVFQARLLRHSPVDNGLFCAVAVLRILLPL